MAILEVEHLKKTYTTRLGSNRVEALKDVNFTVERGEFVAIMGESGSGKTTLLNLLAALDKPTGGQVRLNGKNLGELKEKEIAGFRRENLGFVFQDFNLLDTFSLRDNIYLPLVLEGKKYEEMSLRAEPIAKKLGITQILNKYPYEVSGGQKQRVGIARALVQDPLLMLADEPIASLDPKSSRTVMEHLRWAADELGVACLANLHQVDFAMEFSDRIVALKKGRVVFDGAPHLLDEAAIADIYGTNEEAEAGSDFGERSVRQVGELSGSRTREADPERLGKAEAKDSSSPEVAA